jgi:hypothetical protein
MFMPFAARAIKSVSETNLVNGKITQKATNPQTYRDRAGPGVFKASLMRIRRPVLQAPLITPKATIRRILLRE